MQTIWSDQLGRFPKKSSKGNQCIMVLTESDSNVILVEAMKNHSSGEMIRAYQKLINRLHAARIVPTHHILDNECSHNFKETIMWNEMTYQLIPPHDHCHNCAKKAIQTFKDHFVAISGEPIRSSHSISGTYSYPKLRTCLTCFAHLG